MKHLGSPNPQSRNRYGSMLAMFALVSCTATGPALDARPWLEADGLFTGDALWLGGDGAYSVDLGRGRVLWLFGDSFIATSAAHRRDESVMVRNSVGIQTGYDPSHAFMRFYYARVDQHPASFIPEDGSTWFWPGHGIRIGDNALLFYGRVRQTGSGMWGFSGGAWTAFVVTNPEDEPPAWQMIEANVAATGDVNLGGAVLQIADKLYVYGEGGSRHDIYLARFDTHLALQGNLSTPEWWSHDGWRVGATPTPIITIGAPEYSVNFAASLGSYLFVQSEGFGATTLAVRTAPNPEGPWSEPRDFLRPPESFEADPFVYAGKAHPELTGADLVATYVPSAFEDGPPDPTEKLYYPRFVRIGYR